MNLPARLPDGIDLRPMRGEDASELIAFTTRVFGIELGEPDTTAGVWAGDLLRGNHPTTRPEDGMVAVDRATGAIVACSFLISQIWQFAGIPIRAGRPELIASEPAYRGRGIVRALLDAIHARSATLGHYLQALTGIPVYYRQYGYEPGLLTPGERIGPVDAIAALPPGAGPVHLRAATAADLPLITRLARRAAERSFIATLWDEEHLRYELFVRDHASDYWHAVRIITSSAGDELGILAYRPHLDTGILGCLLCELLDETRWRQLTPPILHALHATGREIETASGAPFTHLSFDWTPDHPLLHAAPEVFPELAKPFAWYVRIPDEPALLHQLAPELERRLAASPFAGETGDLAITRYPRGLHLRFASGRITAIETTPALSHRQADICMPATAWQQLLLGSRSFAELERAFPFETRYRTDRARDLLDTLFPKLPSVIWPIA